MVDPNNGRVLVLAPYSRDAESIVAAIRPHGIDAEAVGSLRALAERLGPDTGAVVLTEEALLQADWTALVEAVRAQPSWSAYPFLLLVSHRRGMGQTEALYAQLPREITNVMVLERPMGTATLVSTVQWALAGRKRQFLTRDHLEQLERNSQQQRLMTRELAHRVKNTIAVLQSIVTQTMRPYPDMAEVRDLIINRFSALARAHDLLISTEFSAADFRTLVDRTVGVHQGDFDVVGPQVQLSPQASLSFALVLHELATNSLKYGSLKADGHVRIAWALDGDGDQQFHFHWIESRGGVVSPPSRKGFGTRLIESTLRGLGEVSLDYPATGFELRFSGPVAGLTFAVVPEFS